MSREVWIGLVNLVPNEGNLSLERAKGAFVNILALAESATHYRNLVQFAAYEHNYSVKEIKDVEPFNIRIKNFEVGSELIELSEKVQSTGRTHFGEFYIYENE